MTVERMEGTDQADDMSPESEATSTQAETAEDEATAVAEGTADVTETTAEAAGDQVASDNGAVPATAQVDSVEATEAVADSVDAAATEASATAEAVAEEVPTAEAVVADASVAEATQEEPPAAEAVAPAADAQAAEAPAAEAPAEAAPAEAAPEAADESSLAEAITETEQEAVPVAAAEAEAEPAAAPPPPAPRVYEGPEPTTMEELLNEQQTEIRSLKHGDVVEGNVVRIDKDEILVDIGAKSEGVISNRELYGRNAETQPQLNIGDQVLVYVLQPESPEGHAVLSLRRAGLERKWRAMQEQLDAGVIIEAPVIDHNKGGLIVDCGIRGFVPISQIVDFPRRPQNEQPRDAAQEIAEKLQPYVGRKLRLKILEVNRKANRLILSEKVALYEERREKRDELFSSLQVGQKVTGTVRSIAPFGVFIDLGGIDGLVHKSELSWNKVNNPEAGYRVGEEVEAEVIDINHERGRISLSIRRLQPDPWHSTVADMKVGDVIDGTVTKIVNFGAFVRVRDGLEGLIHISELSHARVAHPGDVVHEGQTLKLKIISLDQERHRLGLSLKQAEEAPARPEPSERPARRPRGGGDRGYDMSQAVQEPEGGIDNTLAAAFAQVRQQMEETEAARASSEPEDEEAGGATAEAGATTTADATAEAPAEAEAVAEASTVEGDAPAEAPAEATAVVAEEAPAEVTAEADAKPARKGRASAKSKTEAATADETTAEPAAAEDTAPEPESEAPTTEATADADAPTDAVAEAPAKPARKSKASTKAEAAEEAPAAEAEPAPEEPAAEA